MNDSLFLLARQDTARDRRVGLGFWLDTEAERSLRAKHLKDVQQYAGREVSADDFHIRGMLVCNSQRDYWYSRFTRDALDEVVEMLPGAPALYGHDHGGSPVGRIFSARRVRIEDPDLEARDQQWVEALYYVPADADGEAHVRRVDLGVYREVSLGWRVAGEDCSVCKDSIMRCPHIPGDIYEKAGVCEYEFSGITSVLEVSHVYRGGQKDTSTFVPESDPQPAQAASRFVLPGTRDVDGPGLWHAKRESARALSGRRLTLDEWLRTGDGQRAAGFFGFLFGQPGLRADVQAVTVEARRFSAVGRARRWVRDLDFRVDRMRESAGDYVFEQQPEARFESKGWRNVKLDTGVVARVGKRAQQQDTSGAATREQNGDDPLARWLSPEAVGCD